MEVNMKKIMKNDNELMIEALDGFINTFKKYCHSTKKFEELKRDSIKQVISVKNEIGDTDFLNSKEWKNYIVRQRVEDIDKDF